MEAKTSGEQDGTGKKWLGEDENRAKQLRRKGVEGTLEKRKKSDLDNTVQAAKEKSSQLTCTETLTGMPSILNIYTAEFKLRASK